MESSSQQDSPDQDTKGKSPDGIGDLIEFMRTRETYQMEQLKGELEANKQMLGVTIKKHNDDTQNHEASLRDIQEQLTEAQKLEEAMKKDLKRITKDIEHLQRKDLETRNEISTQNRKFFHSRSVQEKKVQESQEKLQQFMADMKQRLEERVKSSEGDSKDRAPSMYDGLDMEAELECPICFELSRPPIFQCPEGHIICGACRPRVSRCPVCRFVFKVETFCDGILKIRDIMYLQGPDIRNRFIEKMSDYYFSVDEN